MRAFCTHHDNDHDRPHDVATPGNPCASNPASFIETAIAEYNALSPLERAYWHGAADSARPCDAWAAWKARQTQTAHDDGQEVGRS